MLYHTYIYIYIYYIGTDRYGHTLLIPVVTFGCSSKKYRTVIQGKEVQSKYNYNNDKLWNKNQYVDTPYKCSTIVD